MPPTEGYPVHVCELLNSLEAPVFIERVSLGYNKQIMARRQVIRRALENQVKGLGFSFVEVLSPCPTIWKFEPLEAQRFVRDEMAKDLPGGQFSRPHEGGRAPSGAPAPPSPCRNPRPAGAGCRDHADARARSGRSISASAWLASAAKAF